MPKRLTDTEKWNRPWFNSLPPEYKMLWLYILDTCDISGVWYANIKLAGFIIGANLEESHAIRLLDKQISVIGPRWIINDFITFQYGKFSKDSRVHQGVLRVLNGHGLQWPEDRLGIGYQYPINRLKDKDKDKDLDKANEKDKVKAKDTMNVIYGGSR